MKLYVDDLRECPKGWFLARTVTEAIRILATRDVTDVSLDHDISHSVNMGNGIYNHSACKETFEPVAWYLAAISFKGLITLHTANPVGALSMKNILADSGIKAMAFFDFTVDVDKGQKVEE